MKKTKQEKMPRWLELQAEIDYWYFILGQMLEQEKFLLPIEKMIEKAIGYDKKKLKDAKEIMDKVDKLKKEFYSIVGH